METKLAKEVRFLKAYAVIATLICGLLLLTAFTLQNRKQKFAEIDVERINVVEKDGSLRLVISNRERSPGPIQRGKPFGYAGGDRPGMIFFNDEGTEAGGLTVGGKRENGDVRASASLTFDQYEQDQTIALQYVDRGGTRRAGLAILDWPTDISSMEKEERWKAMTRMPDGPAKTEERQRLEQFRMKPRIYVGRSRDDGKSLVDLADGEGRTRLRLGVAVDGSARIDFLDEKGKVTYSIPEVKARQ
jgi:hypothetical protein